MQIKLVQSIVHVHAMLLSHTALWATITELSVYLCAPACSGVKLIGCPLPRPHSHLETGLGSEFAHLMLDGSTSALLQYYFRSPTTCPKQPLGAVLSCLPSGQKHWSVQQALVASLSHQNRDLFVEIAKQMSMRSHNWGC